MTKEPTIYSADIPFSIERLRDEGGLGLIKLVKQEALQMLFDEMLKDVSEFEGFNADCNISMEVHSFMSVYNRICELREINEFEHARELERLEGILYKLGTGDNHYGDTHLVGLKLTLNG